MKDLKQAKKELEKELEHAITNGGALARIKRDLIVINVKLDDLADEARIIDEDEASLAFELDVENNLKATLDKLDKENQEQGFYDINGESKDD